MVHSALVTGGAQGLGAALVEALLRHGFNVAIGDLDLEQAESLARRLDPGGARSFAIRLDVRNKAAFERALQLMVSRWGSAEALVNNAVMTEVKPVLDIEPEQFDAVLAVNLRGAFVGSQVFGEWFKAAGYGRIVNIASLAGQNGGAATGAHYAASKGALITLTKVFARDLAPFGVTVNAVAPGPLDLPSVRALLAPERLGAVIGTIPVARLGDPKFVAEVACLLASEQAASVCGATWDINGGLYMR